MKNPDKFDVYSFYTGTKVEKQLVSLKAIFKRAKLYILVDDGSTSQNVRQLGVRDAVPGSDGIASGDETGPTCWNIGLH
jgi:hypothetical protein